MLNQCVINFEYGHPLDISVVESKHTILILVLCMAGSQGTLNVINNKVAIVVPDFLPISAHT